MCGISGVVARNNLSPESKAAVARIGQAQIHRGPDGAGDFFADQAALHSRRLAIIDPDGGWQPLFNEDKSLALVVNGEIYNYVELRRKLEACGHRFRTDSDCEVIVHLYEEHALDFVNHLRGMFALALWDNRSERLILARDRMGEKPLYLFERDGELWFASELKGLLSSKIVPFELDARAVNLYFYYQYVPEPLTAVKGVRKLDAATMLTVDVAKWRLEEKIYWRLEDAAPIAGEPSAVIRQKLEEVSGLIVRSDVPIGVALSGGLDSSVVAAFAAQNQPNLAAFSVGYTGRPESDERADAEKFAKYLNIPFFDVELDTKTIVEFFPELNFWRDDPIADISGFGYYAVMRLARENNVPVLLQGQGGDELFWGYPQLREAFTETVKKTRLLQNPVGQTLIQSLKLSAPKNRSLGNLLDWAIDFGGIKSNLRGARQALQNPDRMVFYDRSTDFALAANHVNAFYTQEFKQQIERTDAYSLFTFPGGWNDLETALTALVCRTYLRENGITQGDRLGMAASVEMRLPLIDYQFVETVVGLRKTQSDANLPAKQWLKTAVKNRLPDWVLNRPKRGFAPPTRRWHNAIFAAHGDSLKNGFLVEAGVLTAASAAHLATGEFPGEATSPLSFKTLVLEKWCRQMSQIAKN